MEKFDVIIAGAGLAGLAAAYTLAGAGLEVLVLERGDYPGAKNVTGGRIYINPVRELFPDFWERAPFERHIAYEEVAVMAAERSLTIRYTGNELSQEPYQSYSILRGKFDRWLGQQAEKKGAMLITKSKVDDLIFEGHKVIGVKSGGDELGADVVIAADGVMSLTAERAGLRKPGDSHHYAVGFKEIIELDESVLENRFSLHGGAGAARLFMGEITKGKFGGGFLYTNRNSISLGMVVGIADLMAGPEEIQAPALLDAFKQRPEVAALIKDGQTVEYSAHVVPEGGLEGMGKLYGDGILVVGDAAGLSLNIGITVRGMEYALASGYYAAQTIIKAKAAGDYSAQTLKLYHGMLEQSFVLQDFKSFKSAPQFLENGRLYTYYPELAGNVMRDLYSISAGPKERIYPTIRRQLKVKELWGMLGDLRKVMKI